MVVSAPTKPPARAGATRKRNAFRRTEVPLIERVISVLIVLLLAGIGVAIAIKGQHFDPNLYALRADALKSTEATVDGKAATLKTQGGGEPDTQGTKPESSQPGDPSTKADGAAKSAGTVNESGEPEGAVAAGEGATVAVSTPVAKASAGAKNEPMELTIPGIKPMGDTEFYNADNLFEKIDGRSGAYLSFNVTGLRCRSFAVVGSKSSFIDVYEYRMDSPVNAFGIFALERDPKGRPIDFAPDGYSGELGFFFRQAAYYIQVIASDQDVKTLELAKAIAVNRAKAFPEDNVGLDARRRLPAANMIPESVAFVLDNAQGQSFLKNVFQAAYQYDGVKLPFFLMVSTPAEAAAAWKSYNEFCSRFGKASALPSVNGAQIFQASSFGKWRVIYQREAEVGGVFDAPDGEKARHFVESYLKGEIK